MQTQAELVQALNLAHANVAPQPPQFARSLVVSTHAPLQSVVPAGQVHAPATHVVPPVQASPQPPQFWLSVLGSTQEAPHFVRLASQVDVQLPALQTWPGLHATAAQAPQCWGSLFRSTQIPPQSVSGAGQVHFASVHVIRSSLHALPQPPQWSALDVRRTQAPPQSTLPFELPPPASPFLEQLPAVHAPSRHTSPFSHFVPQSPQFARSEVTSRHAPSHAS